MLNLQHCPKTITVLVRSGRGTRSVVLGTFHRFGITMASFRSSNIHKQSASCISPLVGCNRGGRVLSSNCKLYSWSIGRHQLPWWQVFNEINSPSWTCWSGLQESKVHARWVRNKKSKPIFFAKIGSLSGNGLVCWTGDALYEMNDLASRTG